MGWIGDFVCERYGGIIQYRKDVAGSLAYSV